MENKDERPDVVNAVFKICLSCKNYYLTLENQPVSICAYCTTEHINLYGMEHSAWW